MAHGVHCVVFVYFSRQIQYLRVAVTISLLFLTLLYFLSN